MYSAGIDFGGTSTKLALVGADGRLLARRDVPARPDGDADRLFGELAAILAGMAGQAGLPFPRRAVPASAWPASSMFPRDASS